MGSTRLIVAAVDVAHLCINEETNLESTSESEIKIVNSQHINVQCKYWFSEGLLWKPM